MGVFSFERGTPVRVFGYRVSGTGKCRKTRSLNREPQTRTPESRPPTLSLSLSPVHNHAPERGRAQDYCNAKFLAELAQIHGTRFVRTTPCHLLALPPRWEEEPVTLTSHKHLTSAATFCALSATLLFAGFTLHLAICSYAQITSSCVAYGCTALSPLDLAFIITDVQSQNWPICPGPCPHFLQSARLLNLLKRGPLPPRSSSARSHQTRFPFLAAPHQRFSLPAVHPSRFPLSPAPRPLTRRAVDCKREVDLKRCMHAAGASSLLPPASANACWRIGSAARATLQGYLAHKKTPTPLGPH